MGKPIGAKGSVMIFVPLLEVIWKKEWPNHFISMKPEAAARTRKGLSFPATFGFLQAASTGIEEAKRKIKDIVSSTKKLGFFFMVCS
jgi:hypothetical protein